MLFSSKNNVLLLTHPALKAMSRLAGGHNYDVMDNHADKFKKPEEEFQPRIVNKENAQSKLLANSNFYQPPLRRKKPKTPTTARSEAEFEEEEKQEEKATTTTSEKPDQESKPKETNVKDDKPSDISNSRSLNESAISQARFVLSSN